VTITGKGAVLEAAGSAFEVVDLAFDPPGLGEVLVKMTATGMCHTDLGIQETGMPFALPGVVGHEGAGIVELVGPGVSSVVPGDKVLLSFTSCGHCPSCERQHPAYCEMWFPLNLLGMLRGEDSGEVRRANGEVLHSHFMGQSSFAQYAIAAERSVVKVDRDADLVTLAPLGCGVITGVGSMWNVLDPRAGDVVAVYGTGAVGLSAVWAAARRKPAQLIAIDRVASRLELARALGATDTIDASKEDVETRLHKLTDEYGVTLSFDTTAHPAVAAMAVGASSVGGTVLVCGAPPLGTTIPVEAVGLLQGRSLKGVTYGDALPPELIGQLVQLHREGALPLEKLEKTYSLKQIQQAAEDMRHGVTIKPVIVF